MRGSGSSLPAARTPSAGGQRHHRSRRRTARAATCSSKADRTQLLPRPRAAHSRQEPPAAAFNTASASRRLYVANGLNGDSPFRDVGTQGRITFHFTPKLRLTARLYAADSFSKVLGSADTLGNPTGFGIVNAIPNVNFTPTPDDPDSTRAARFIDAALILNGEASPAFDYSASYQLVSNSRRYGNGPAGPGYQPDGNTRSLYDGHIQTADAQFHYRLGRFNPAQPGGYEFRKRNPSRQQQLAEQPALRLQRGHRHPAQQLSVRSRSDEVPQ